MLAWAYHGSMKTPRSVLRLALAIWLLPMAVACAQQREITVNAEKKGDVLVVDAEFSVRAGVKECWKVLTDFDNMASFVEGMQSSKVTKRSDNVLEIVQKGRSSYGLFSLAYESVRRITLKPEEEIRSHGIGGTVKQYDGVTRLIPEGDVTRIVYHAESVPGVAAPGTFVVSFARSVTRRQFGDMRAEILRRQVTPDRDR